jgi:hypothetical protein
MGAVVIERIGDQAFKPAREAVEAGRIPGAALGVVSADGAQAVRVAGMAALLPEPEPLTERHWFDLASVSKVIATTTMILQVAEQGRLDLDRPLTDAIPDLRQYDVENAPERRSTFPRLPAHRTFLPAVEPIYTKGDDPPACASSCCSASGGQARRSIPTSTSSCSASRSSGSRRAAFRLAARPGLSFGPPPVLRATEICTWRAGDEGRSA